MNPAAIPHPHSPVITLSLPRIRQSVLDCLAEAGRRIASSDLARATTLRFWIDGRFGQCGVGLNDDDDADFQWSEGMKLTIGCVHESEVGEIGDLEARYSDLSEPDAGGADQEPMYPTIVLVDPDASREIRLPSLCDFCAHLAQEVVPWVKEWIAARDSGEWLPCNIAAAEINSFSGESWRDERRQLPPPREHPKSAFFAGLKVEQGLKVYLIDSNARGFAGGNLDWRLRLNHRPLANELSLPVPIMVWADNSRVGGLVSLSHGRFALRADHPASGEARALLGDDTEWLPAHDGAVDWLLPNVLAQADVIDPDATQFSEADPERRYISIPEFVPEQLKAVKRLAFTVKGDFANNLYFLERPGEESFPEFCWRVGLVGVRWQLVWCEDIGEMERELGAYVSEIEALVKRNRQTPRPGSVLRFDGIYGGQRDLWNLARFRAILREHGLAKAIEEVQGLGRIRIPSIRRICAADWWSLNRPKNPAIEKALAESLAGRDVLHEVRGYICAQLPMQLRILREMAAGGAG